MAYNHLDPTLLPRTLQGFKKGVARFRSVEDASRSELEVIVPSWSRDWAQNRKLRTKGVKIVNEEDGKQYLREIFLNMIHPMVVELARSDADKLTIEIAAPPQFVGQRGDAHFSLKIDNEEILVVAMEAKIAKSLRRFYEERRKIADAMWPPLSSTFLDLRPAKRPSAPSKVEDPTSPIIEQLALQMYEAERRFGFFFAPPYFLLVELVLEDGHLHLLLSDLCADDPNSLNVARQSSRMRSGPVSQFRQSLHRKKSFQKKTRAALRAAAKAVNEHNLGGPRPIPPKLK
ncbi:BQ2448_4248 [Microbotryum intermedium]|uniref:BQ2448_4248 protein n=1 Tax=Microbotryum intermedium TaxID=269621 RepID=A0A238FKN6_9BASI|nr:BQ2448_4248 [Microbotryum intermedium]